MIRGDRIVPVPADFCDAVSMFEFALIREIRVRKIRVHLCSSGVEISQLCVFAPLR